MEAETRSNSSSPLPSPLWWTLAAVEGSMHGHAKHTSSILCSAQSLPDTRLSLLSAWMPLLTGTKLPPSLVFILFPVCIGKAQQTLITTYIDMYVVWMYIYQQRKDNADGGMGQEDPLTCAFLLKVLVFPTANGVTFLFSKMITTLDK